MKRITPKAQATILVAGSSLAVFLVMAGLLIVPKYAIAILTLGAAIIGGVSLLLMPSLVSTERDLRRARGEGTGAHDASTHRGICAECGWHWRVSPNDHACPRCGAPIETQSTPA
ncbi:MAG: hypothetical protein ACIAQF_06515 [Phycisphaerales bacterium JB065]